MKNINNRNVLYFDSQCPHALNSFSESLRNLINSRKKKNQELIFLCIGTDKVMGDCLGPILGYRLKRNGCKENIYGDLDFPVHAQNIKTVVKDIKKKHPRAFVIAIDASLGLKSHVGFITLGTGALYPGAGVGKELPKVGNVYITGIVNSSSTQDFFDNTRLNIVMNLADTIYEGITKAELESL